MLQQGRHHGNHPLPDLHQGTVPGTRTHTQAHAHTNNYIENATQSILFYEPVQLPGKIELSSLGMIMK